MRKPIRAAAICIKDEQILLMWRKKGTKEFWVFPGGSVEDSEEPEQSVIRELQEETTINARVDKLLYHLIFDQVSEKNWGSEQYFYLCSYISGEPHLREDSEELEKMKKGKSLYKPQWVAIKKLSSLLLYPLEVRDWLVEDIKTHFSNTPHEASLKLSEMRDE